MQTASGPAARAPMIVTVIAVVLAVIGFGVALSGAADKPSDKVASSGGSSTTTEVPTTLLPGVGGETTLTTAVGGGATTTGRSTATTAKTTATTGAGGTPDCPTPPQATADPGAQQPPAVGTYTFVKCEDATKTSSSMKVEELAPKDPKRRNITQETGGFSQTTKIFYGPNGVYQESFVIGGAITCDWNPDVLEWPATPAIGATWSADSKCTVSTPQGSADIHLTASAKITARVQVTIGGTAVNAWAFDSTAHLATHTKDGDQSIDVTATVYYDPTRGVDLYRNSKVKGSSGDTTVVERLKSLTPSANG